uniref:C-type lectin domain-containing protein n=1 Tax=Gasterosteus aculeatus aculeatus TaxID=481459 RepID=A0AAQ4S5U6_GASAC
MHASRAFHGTWNDTRCDQAKPYVCKISSGLNLFFLPKYASFKGENQTKTYSCLPFWVPYGRYCYAVYGGLQGYSWPDARHYCQSFRADLVSIHSRAEVDVERTSDVTIGSFEFLFLVVKPRLSAVLVGWAWTDRTSLGFLNWAPNEPNAAFHPGDVAEESCVEMYQDGRWNDNDLNNFLSRSVNLQSNS